MIDATQDYTSYTDEDRSVWRDLYRHQQELLDRRVCAPFAGCLAALELRAEEIPELDAFSDRLERLSGWRVQAADGQLSGHDYWGLIGDRRFPSITSLRGRHELGHAVRPDMFHDIFGHIPLLLDRTYSEYIQGMAEIALDHLDDEAGLARHGNAYKWTIEYGLIDEGGATRVYGAGLISSSTEIDHALGDAPRRRAFGMREAMDTPHVPASLQDRYFVIRSFRQLVDGLPELRRELER